MSTVYGIPDDPTFDLLGFDVTISESHPSEAQPTEFPVEGGSVITDHVVQAPDVFSAVVLVTETPTDGGFYGDGGDIETSITVARYLNGVRIPAELALKGVGPLDTSRSLVTEMHERLLKMKKEAVVMTLLTSTIEYSSMILVSVELTREALTRGRGEFTLTFRKLETVETATVAAPKPKEPRGEKLKAKGAQTEKETAAKVKGNLKSLAAQALDGDLNIQQATANFLGFGGGT